MKLPKLKTKRLILRKPSMKDIPELIEVRDNLSVAKYLMGSPYPYTKKDAVFWIKREAKSRRKKKPDAYRFVIELKLEKKVIGWTGFHDVRYFDLTAKSGSCIAKKYQGKGYITEAKIALNDFGFNKLKLRKIISEVSTKNKISNNMAKKFGFKLEGVLRKQRKSKATNTLHDMNTYGLLKSEWKKVRKKIVDKLNKRFR